MSAGENLRKVFRTLGYDETKNGLRIIPTLHIVFSILQSIGSYIYIEHNMGKYDATGMRMANMLKSATDIDHMFAVIAISFNFMICGKSMEVLMQIADKDYSSYYQDFSKKQKEIIKRSKVYQNNILRKTGSMLSIITFIGLFIPGCFCIYLIFKEGLSNINVSKLPLPYMVGYPDNYDTFKSYIIVYILQVPFVLYIYILAYVFFGAIVTSFQSIITDIILFCDDLCELDEVLKHCQDRRIIVLRDYRNYLIRCHQRIQSQVKLVTTAVSWPITINNHSLCFLICTTLYSAAEVQDIASKIIFIVLMLSVSLILYVYSRYGQAIIDSSADIRMNLYECPWLDKPLWFKRDLQIMMAIAGIPLHIKPLGFYEIGLNNFSTLMNTAYTYFSVLRTVKS